MGKKCMLSLCFSSLHLAFFFCYKIIACPKMEIGTHLCVIYKRRGNFSPQQIGHVIS